MLVVRLADHRYQVYVSSFTHFIPLVRHFFFLFFFPLARQRSVPAISQVATSNISRHDAWGHRVLEMRGFDLLFTMAFGNNHKSRTQ
jgi:hypothetical protein